MNRVILPGFDPETLYPPYEKYQWFQVRLQLLWNKKKVIDCLIGYFYVHLKGYLIKYICFGQLIYNCLRIFKQINKTSLYYYM